MVIPDPSFAGSRRRRAASTTRALLVAGLVVAVAGSVGVWVEVRSVIASGPVLAVVGCLTVWSATVSRYRAALSVAAAHVGVCLLFVGLVLVLRWGPVDATLPFRLMAPTYALAVAWPTWRAWHRRPGDGDPPGVCRGCGYLLRGLDTPRCPECGRPFDPAELTA